MHSLRPLWCPMAMPNRVLSVSRDLMLSPISSMISSTPQTKAELMKAFDSSDTDHTEVQPLEVLMGVCLWRSLWGCASGGPCGGVPPGCCMETHVVGGALEYGLCGAMHWSSPTRALLLVQRATHLVEALHPEWTDDEQKAEVPADS